MLFRFGFLSSSAIKNGDVGSEHWDDGWCLLRWEERDSLMDQRHSAALPLSSRRGVSFPHFSFVFSWIVLLLDRNLVFLVLFF